MACIEVEIGHDKIFSKILVLRVSTATRGFDDFFAAGAEFRVMYQYDIGSLYKNLQFELSQSFQA